MWAFSGDRDCAPAEPPTAPSSSAKACAAGRASEGLGRGRRRVRTPLARPMRCPPPAAWDNGSGASSASTGPPGYAHESRCSPGCRVGTGKPRPADVGRSVTAFHGVLRWASTVRVTSTAMSSTVGPGSSGWRRCRHVGSPSRRPGHSRGVHYVCGRWLGRRTAGVGGDPQGVLRAPGAPGRPAARPGADITRRLPTRCPAAGDARRTPARCVCLAGPRFGLQNHHPGNILTIL